MNQKKQSHFKETDTLPIIVSLFLLLAVVIGVAVLTTWMDEKKTGQQINKENNK
jgi:hypothetical protein